MIKGRLNDSTRVYCIYDNDDDDDDDEVDDDDDDDDDSNLFLYSKQH